VEEKQTHVVEINASADAVWAEITKLKQIQKPFFGTVLETDFKPGSRLVYKSEDGTRAFILGEIIECDPPRKLVHTFRFTNLAETPTRVEWTLEAKGPATRVTVVHSQFKDQKETAKSVLTSWPAILGDVKAVVETGDAPFGTRVRNWMMSTFAFMAPKETLIENIAELKGEKR
jgi:uncharacterized protein YndB with AHSA1/START domain